MFNISWDRPSSQPQEFKIAALSLAERVIYWTIVLTPIWWLLGIQPLFYPAVVSILLAVIFEIDKLINNLLPPAVWAWLVMALVMFWTAMLGIYTEGFSFNLAAATFVTFLKSYFLIFCCLAIPFWSRVRVSVVTRAVAWMATGFLVNIAVQMVMLGVGLGSMRYVPLLGRLIPGDKGSLTVKFAKMAAFFGIPLPRTTLHTPDPPILGVCALLCFVICLGESNRRLRNWALVGSFCALLVSFSRLALVCLPFVLLVVALFRSQFTRQLSLWLTSASFLFCSLLGITVKQLMDRPMDVFDSARATSSEVRGKVIAETLKAWQQELWLGWGVIRGSAWLYEDKYIKLGSFSSYAAVLYLHGIVGFIVFIVAMFLTLSAFYAPAVGGDLTCKRVFASLVALYVLMQATALSWMAVYLWFFFVWLGAVMFEVQQRDMSLSSWEQL